MECQESASDRMRSESMCNQYPAKRSKPAKSCSTRDQLSILAALEDVDSDELSYIDIDVYKCSSDDNIYDSSDLDEDNNELISIRKKKEVLLDYVHYHHPQRPGA